MIFLLAAATMLHFSALPPRQPVPPQLRTIGVDPLTSAGTEHAVAVGPVVATNGFTTVTVYQVGRYSGDAAAAMAYSTSNIFGFGVQEGLLPGITKAQNPSNPYDRVTFETIAWNQKYNEFIVSTLPIVDVPSQSDSDTTLPPEVSRSTDGIHWTNPTPVATGGLRPEKSWIACDNGRTSPHYGNCYVAWDDNDDNDSFHVDVSTDGGVTWNPSQTTGYSEYGALPVVQQNGNVVVTSEDSNGYDGTEANILSSVSTDGGATFSKAYEVAPITTHTVAATMRTQSLPTSLVDGAGNVYTIWQDCRFETGCSANDLVMSSSPDGMTWSTPIRLPLDPVGSGVDHFLPAVSIRNSFFGTTLALTYYEFPQAGCTVSTCQLIGMSSYTGNFGRSFSAPTALTPPMNVTWLATTGAGYMVGDYLTTTFPGWLVAPITFASAPSSTQYNEAIGLPQTSFPSYFTLGTGVPRMAFAVPDSAALHADRRPVLSYNAPRLARQRTLQRRHRTM